MVPLDLSVVLCGRNDGYAGDFTNRLRRTLFSLMLGLCRQRARLASEIVLVEWRPPSESKSLGSLVLEWIREAAIRPNLGLGCDGLALPDLRLVTVGEVDAEKAFSGIRQTPQPGMLEWHCKSVGLRRANGDMILTINADDILSPALFHFLAHARRLRRDTFYLAQTTSISFKERDIGRGRKYKDAFFEVYDDLFRGHASQIGVQDLAAMLQQMHRPELAFSRDQRLCEHPQALWASNHSRQRSLWRGYDMKQGLDVNRTEEPGRANAMPLNFFDIRVGDFILASRVAWRRIGGAPMLLQSIAIDYMVSCRFARTLRQVVLVAPCFNVHQEHPPSMVLERRRIDARPKELGNHNMWQHCRRPYDHFPSERGILRREWGFPKHAFPEIHLMPGAKGFTLVTYRRLGA